MRFNSSARAALFGAVLATSAAFGQPASAQATDDTLYQQLGGQSGLVTLMDDFMTQLLADRKSTRLNSSHSTLSRMPSSA